MLKLVGWRAASDADALVGIMYWNHLWTNAMSLGDVERWGANPQSEKGTKHSEKDSGKQSAPSDVDQPTSFSV